MPDPPARLSPAALGAVLAEAIERARDGGALSVLDRSVDFPGYRRQLLGRFASWTRSERHPNRAAPEAGEAGAEEWALFGHYRSVLEALNAEDAAGWAARASKALGACQAVRRPGHVVVIDPVEPTRARLRLLDHLEARSRSMLATLPFEADPGLAELYSTTEAARARFLERGFVEEAVGPGSLGLSGHRFGPIERDLFRLDAHTRAPLRVDDLKILGAPRGEGVGLLVAREVLDQLDRGRHPEEILILAPRVDEDAETVRAVLRSWGLPVAPAPPTRLAAVPAVSALRQAARLPVDDWEAGALGRLLRNGQVRWAEAGTEGDLARFEAASAIRSTRVYRRLEPLRQALRRSSEGDRPVEARNALAALGAVERLANLLGPIARAGAWAAQVDRLRDLAAGLALDRGPLEPLWDALDDHGWVLEGLGPAVAEQSRTWPEFVAAVDAIVAADDPSRTPRPPSPGTIPFEAVADAEGARAAVVILVNLAEKTFPNAEALDPGPAEVTEGDDEVEAEAAPAPIRAGRAYAREMLRFARVVGSADERLVLAYPTTDLNGEALLPAVFLDEVIRGLDPTCLAACSEAHARFDPVLRGRPDLAVAPVDARVLAVADACLGRGADRVRDLAATAAHGPSLRGVAEAFRVAHVRRVDRPFGPHDGLLGDDRVIARVLADFGPDHAFSASQLESFALCPFQFFQRFALGLKPVDDGDELEEDYAHRGREIHRALEEIHQQMHGDRDENLIDRLPILIENRMAVELEQHDGREADVAAVLREIAARRTRKVLARYVAQFREYDLDPDSPVRPHRFEVKFGEDDAEGQADPIPHLTVGEGPAAVKIQGVIDRVDLVTAKDGEVRFRVIDYKTGSNPSAKDVQAGLASQLPLYALAVERLGLAPEAARLDGFGYWSLPKSGYKRIPTPDWAGYSLRLSAYIVALVGRLREGKFPIDSRKKDCRKFCDFQAICRVGEVRSVGKVWVDRPSMAEPEA